MTLTDTLHAAHRKALVVRRAQAAGSAAELAAGIRVQLRGERAVVADLNTAVPAVSVWFEIHNHSDVDVVLDRIVLEVWAGQPVLMGVMADRRSVVRHSTVENVHFRGLLVPAAVDLIRQEMIRTGPRSNYTVYATAYFDSPEGAFEIRPENLFREIPAA